MTKNEIKASLGRIKHSLARANSNLNFWLHVPADPDEEEYAKTRCAYWVERAFLQLLVLLETLGLLQTYAQLGQCYAEARGGETGFADTAMYPSCDDPHLVWQPVMEHFFDAIATTYDLEASLTITTDLESLLRSALYSITDEAVYPGPPGNEAEVHARIESILRCVYPDLKTKPTLTKPIKNFQPDTGLPAARTLIEYKFISSVEGARAITDEILADTRGYTSPDWDTFVYVIYETRRVKQEREWSQLMEKCGLNENTRVIVLSGEQPSKPRQKNKNRNLSKSSHK